ncbi:hypothetical protein ACOMHN_050291 [Nucella lapillus]
MDRRKPKIKLITMATSHERPPRDVSQGLREAVRCGEWWTVVDLSEDSACGHQQRQWAIREAVMHAPLRVVEEILEDLEKDQLDWVLTKLAERRLWRCVDLFLQSYTKIISSEQHTRAVEEAMKYSSEQDFVDFVLHHCIEKDLQGVLTHMVSRGLWNSVVDSNTQSDVIVTQHILSQIVSRGSWEAVGRFLQRDISREQHRWAVEQASKHADDGVFAVYILPQCHHEELEEVMTHLVSRGLWYSVGKVLKKGVSTTQHRWAVEQASKHADDENFVHLILPQCRDGDLQDVMTHLVSRSLWYSVGEVLKKGVSTTQHRWAVEQARKLGDGAAFTHYILPQCHDDELKNAMTHLMSRGLWYSVGKILKQGVSPTQHRWAVEQASKLADGENFVCLILPQCRDEDLEKVMTYLMSRGLWYSVGKMLKKGVSTTQHKRAVQQASKHADDYDFVDNILPQCRDEELEEVITNLVTRGLWRSIYEVLDRRVSTTQHKRAVQQASKHADDYDFVDNILPQCRDEELEEVITNLVTRGLWRSIYEVLDRRVSTTQHRWAVEQASKLPQDNDFVHFILPHCQEEELEEVITHLVTRGLWWSVGKVLERGVSIAQHRWAMEQARKHADYDDFVHFILPQCHDDELDEVMTHLVSQGLWGSVGEVLERDVSTTQHRWAVEQASKHADDAIFLYDILPKCHDEELEEVLTHLVSRGLWRSVSEVLERGVSTAQHRWAVEQASKHADDDSFVHLFLRHCSIDDVVQVFPHLVAKKKWECTRHVLYDVVRDTLYAWMTSHRDRGVNDTLFWKLLCNCRSDVSMALDLTKAVMQETPFQKYRHSVKEVSSGLGREMSCRNELCQSLVMTLLHTLCCVTCSDEVEYTRITQHIEQCVSDIYTHITDCIQDITNSLQLRSVKDIKKKRKQKKIPPLKTIKNKNKKKGMTPCYW